MHFRGKVAKALAHFRGRRADAAADGLELAHVVDREARLAREAGEDVEVTGKASERRHRREDRGGDPGKAEPERTQRRQQRDVERASGVADRLAEILEMPLQLVDAWRLVADAVELLPHVVERLAKLVDDLDDDLDDLVLLVRHFDP